MNKYKIILWYAFPVVGLISWIIFAGVQTNRLVNIYFLLNPAVLFFYLSSLLFTIPINIFSIIAFVCGRFYLEKGKNIGKHCIMSGIFTTLLSLLWFLSIYLFGWIVTA